MTIANKPKKKSRVYNLRFILTEECPQTPTSSVNQTSRKAHE